MPFSTFLKKPLAIVFLIGAVSVSIAAYSWQKELVAVYQKQASAIITDRFGEVIAIIPNEKGYYNQPLGHLPSKLAELLVKKEDKFFYWHQGVNPVSLAGAVFGRLGFGSRQASSTISQQLTKVLLGNENDRSLRNKFEETLAAVSLEVFQSKKEILKMYANSVYFGSQAQGVFEASRLYFGKDPEMLDDREIEQLLVIIPHPSLGGIENPEYPRRTRGFQSEPGLIGRNYYHFDESFFELKKFLKDSSLGTCQTTIDKTLNVKIREIVQRNLEDLKLRDARNAAVLVAKLSETESPEYSRGNEVLAMVGSPDPESLEFGNQINMLFEPRPIGSTIKPFIYLKAFEKGLRPYALVDDREYKYITALGFPLYPKNFDYQYRGKVDLHYSLSNSLNVPSVKVLEYVGLADFYNFLEKDLGLKPIQPWHNYQLGIALGALELNLWDLSERFTIFANKGILKEFQVLKGGSCATQPAKDESIADPAYIQLINKILSDRKTSIDQFGLKSELNLFQQNYALKTGTSRDFKDSWVVGYTPDFLVGVWVGNTDNSPTDQVSGQQGAGLIFSQVMELLFNSQYNRKTPFENNLLKEFKEEKNIEYGLPGDNYQEIKNKLCQQDTSLIVFPHDGDSFLLKDGMEIKLEAKETVNWFINGEFLGHGKTKAFSPVFPGYQKIRAESLNNSEEISIYLTSK